MQTVLSPEILRDIPNILSLRANSPSLSQVSLSLQNVQNVIRHISVRNVF